MDKLRHDLLWLELMGVNDIYFNRNVNKDVEIQEICDLNLLKAIEEKVQCTLKKTATKMVFGDGNINSKIVFVGEAPGAEEDKHGIPFVGQAGQLLNKAIEAIGLKREDVYITNVIPWRPIANRTPTTEEVQLFRPFLIQHINIINPKIVVCLGSSAMKAILQDNTSISKIRGTKIENRDIFKNKDTILLATFHPAYLLRSPSQKRFFWHDFLKIKHMLSDLN